MKARLKDGDLYSPTVGLWREAPSKGSLVTAGARLGRIEILGELHDIVAPELAFGVVTEIGGDEKLARRPVGYDELLLRLDREAVGAPPESAAAADRASGANVFLANTSGRFYTRPSPDRDPFVSPGDDIKAGDPVALLEVMKTFTRLPYEGAPARVKRVVPSDGDDLEIGDVILELE